MLYIKLKRPLFQNFQAGDFLNFQPVLLSPKRTRQDRVENPNAVHVAPLNIRNEPDVASILVLEENEDIPAETEPNTVLEQIQRSTPQSRSFIDFAAVSKHKLFIECSVVSSCHDLVGNSIDPFRGRRLESILRFTYQRPTQEAVPILQTYLQFVRKLIFMRITLDFRSQNNIESWITLQKFKSHFNVIVDENEILVSPTRSRPLNCGYAVDKTFKITKIKTSEAIIYTNLGVYQTFFPLLVDLKACWDKNEFIVDPLLFAIQNMYKTFFPQEVLGQEQGDVYI